MASAISFKDIPSSPVRGSVEPQEPEADVISLPDGGDKESSDEDASRPLSLEPTSAGERTKNKRKLEDLGQVALSAGRSKKLIKTSQDELDSLASMSVPERQMWIASTVLSIRDRSIPQVDAPVNTSVWRVPKELGNYIDRQCFVVLMNPDTPRYADKEDNSAAASIPEPGPFETIWKLITKKRGIGYHSSMKSERAKKSIIDSRIRKTLSSRRCDIKKKILESLGATNKDGSMKIPSQDLAELTQATVYILKCAQLKVTYKRMARIAYLRNAYLAVMEKPDLDYWSFVDKSLHEARSKSIARQNQYMTLILHTDVHTFGAPGAGDSRLKELEAMKTASDKCVPVYVLFQLFVDNKVKEDRDERLDKVENIRLGTFDERVLLGSLGEFPEPPSESDGFSDSEEEEEYEKHAEFYEGYLPFTPNFNRDPTLPRSDDPYAHGNNPFDPEIWAEIEENGENERRCERFPFQLLKPPEPDAYRRSAALRENAWRSLRNSVIPSFPKFNDLPQELGRRIFEIAYYDSPEFPVTWVYISRLVKEWIEPLVYDDCRFFFSTWRLDRYKRTFESKPKEFYARSVRRIYISRDLRDENCIELKLLLICDNLTSLECWVPRPLNNLVDILSRRDGWDRLRVLCLNIDLLPKDERIFQLPIFQNVTRLDIQSKEPHLPSWKSLKSLENLTHMRVDMLDENVLDPSSAIEARRIVDQVYDLATAAREYFPIKLKQFVVLLPLERILSVLLAHFRVDGAGGLSQWERLRKLGRGEIDKRVKLCSLGDWETVEEHNLEIHENLPQDGIGTVIAKLYEFPNFESATFPRVHTDENDTWEDFM
ncbi:hypothetical protein NP233_g5005 [Leucocoprinus birnbaumii]|uniref:Uncharacterized protein n=1 Tax=Leucocoprinus birnbaumii TaxID=56174 RepID=A0AAD5VTQ4_9AGAR|nr:hypothetical protein NP233_g5005 [Leucocoprinus birnbaumii]